MKQLSARQTAIILSVSIISLKFIIFPAIITQGSQNNAYITVIFSLLFDLLFFLIILGVMKKYPYLTFFEILQNGLGKILSKIIIGVLAVYFFLKLIISIKEMHNYLYELLFESFSWYYFIFPTIALIVYITFCGVRGFGRSLEFMFPILAVFTIITILMPLNTIEFDNILPFLPDGLLPVLGSTVKTNFAFGDYFVLLILMGKLKYEKKTTKKIVKWILITDLFVVLFFVLFICVLGNLTVNESLAVNDIPLYANISSINGRLEWASTIVWSIVLVFQSSILMYCCSECVNYSLSFINKKINMVIICIALYAILRYLYLSLAMALNFILSKPFVIFTISVQIALPIIFIIAMFVGGKKNEKLNKQNQKQ